MNHARGDFTVTLQSRLAAARMLLDACLCSVRAALTQTESRLPVGLPLSPLSRKVAVFLATILLACLFLVGELMLQVIGRQKQGGQVCSRRLAVAEI